MLRPLLVLGALLALLFAPAAALAAYAQTDPVAEWADETNTCEVIRYTETDVAAASEAVVTLKWRFGYILSIQQDRTAGAGATLNTRFGRDAGFTASTLGQVGVATATADYIHEQSGGTVFFLRSTKKLYIRATPNAGTDNAVSTELIVCRGRP